MSLRIGSFRIGMHPTSLLCVAVKTNTVPLRRAILVLIKILENHPYVSANAMQLVALLA